jgi:type IV pilus assembly protein PilV
MKKKPQLHTATKAFTLVEVLIAVFIFSFALLGVASLQITGLRLSHDSLLRTYATQLSSDMADRIRANRTAAQLGVNSPYNNPLAASTGNPNCLGLDTVGNNLDSQCTATQIAQHDFYEWYAQLQGQTATGWHSAVTSRLPGASAVVCIDSTPEDGTPAAPACDNIATPGANMFTIKIWWNERKDGGALNNSTHRFVTTIIP